MVDIGESRVEEMMTRDIHVLRADIPIDQALFICAKEGLSDIIVIDEEGRYLGVVRSLEILNYINPLLGVHIGRRTMGHTSFTRMNPSIGELMTHAHVAIRKDARLSEALLHMRRDHHRYLVVVDEGQRVLGKLELFGIIAFLIERGTFSMEKDL
jgi:CBS domain-containing protein